MARMIPPTLNAGATKSPGEALVFTLLRDAPEAEGWVVLHSQRLARLRRKERGEADFVVLVPGKGVLVLEVKAHRHVARKGGRWLYGEGRQEGKDPFRQANDAMFAILDQIRTSLPQMHEDMFVTDAVAFTHVSPVPHGTEWRASQLLDAREMTQARLPAAIIAALDSGAHELRRATRGRRPCLEESRLSAEALDAVVQVLRPDFDLVASPSTRRQTREAELLRLTAEQYTALDAMASNDVVVFEGAAGTGKTLLAIEAARRAIESGDRVLLMCHNRALAVYLRASLGNVATENRVVVGTLHSFLQSITSLQPPKRTQAHTRFFRADLPEAALDVLTTPVAAGGFDVSLSGFDTIIIDELQDLAAEEYLSLIPHLLRHQPTKNGRVFCFGDIENQAFFNRHDARETRHELKNHLPGCTFFRLTVNCRNTLATVDLVDCVVGVRPPYTAVRRTDSNVEPEFVSVGDDAARQLASILDKLEAQGYVREGTVVLSLRPITTCLAASLQNPKWRDRLQELGAATKHGAVQHASVYQYKGLESPAVIVTDLREADIDAQPEALYVALTRSTEVTILLVDAQARTAIQKRLLARLRSRRNEGSP